MISIIVPTYKDAPYLARAIESVRAQSRADWELIIVDDGLTPAARAVVAHYTQSDLRIICIQNDHNLGIQKSLNRALKIAQGEYIARIDDDDEWTDKDKLAKQIMYLEQHPDCVLVGTNAVIVDEQGNAIGTYRLTETNTAIRSRILSKNCFLHPTILARKDAIQKVGGYPETTDTLHIEDYALWLKLGTIGTVANISDLTTQLMLHPQSMTAKNRVAQVRHMRTLIKQYKNVYPGYMRGYMVLSIRILGFLVLEILPVPKKLLYFIQRIYKRF